MKIGVLAFLTEKSGDPGAIAREAENVGFESFFVAEHLVMPSHYTTYYPRGRDGKVPEFYASLIDPFVALAIAAHSTTRIKIGTAICLLPERDVIETAKITGSIDLYSKGRLILGVGAGWFPEEAQIMGVNFPRRWTHLRESVEALRLLWAKDDVSYEGEFVKFPAVKLGPKPVQKPGPPILLGAHDPKYALKRVARYADGWCPGGLSVENARDMHTSDQADGARIRSRRRQARILRPADGRRRPLGRFDEAVCGGGCHPPGRGRCRCGRGRRRQGSAGPRPRRRAWSASIIHEGGAFASPSHLPNYRSFTNCRSLEACRPRCARGARLSAASHQDRHTSDEIAIELRLWRDANLDFVEVTAMLRAGVANTRDTVRRRRRDRGHNRTIHHRGARCG